MPTCEQLKLRTLSAIHTGGVDRRSREVRTSGIMGGLRWWYEALVRGMGGYACDPTEPDSCAFDAEAYRQTGRIEDGLREVCPACRVFGCTGWRRKFNLVITNADGMPGELRLDRPGIDFGVRLVLRRPLIEEERWLLSRTLYVIDRYGSLGGRTTMKPPKFPDFGLIKMVQNIRSDREYRAVAAWLKDQGTRSEEMSRKMENIPPEYPNVQYFFFNRGYWLDRQRMNDVVAADPTGFMRGARGVSKKLFSFSRGEGKRFWGYTTGEDMLKRILDQLATMGIRHTKTGREVLHEL